MVCVCVCLAFACEDDGQDLSALAGVGVNLGGGCGRANPKARLAWAGGSVIRHAEGERESE